MSTPLKAFMDTLHKCDVKKKTPHTTPVLPPDCSTTAHTHTSGGFASPDKGMKCEEKCEDPLTLPTNPIQPDWLFTWRNLAQLTDGITKDDPRFLSICEGLEDCDLAWEQDNWTIFQQAAEAVKRLVEENEIGG